MDDPLIWVRAIHFGATMMVTGGMFFLAFIAEPAFRAADGMRVAAFVRALSSSCGKCPVSSMISTRTDGRFVRSISR